MASDCGPRCALQDDDGLKPFRQHPKRSTPSRAALRRAAILGPRVRPQRRPVTPPGDGHIATALLRPHEPMLARNEGKCTRRTELNTPARV